MLSIAVPAGLLIGVLLGALGGGGSILTVPVLVYLLHQDPHAAMAGSLLIVGITAAAGTIAHRRAGRVRLAPGIAFAVLGVAGSFAGTRLSASVPPDLLLTLFAGLLLAAAAAMLRRRPGTARRREHAGGSTTGRRILKITAAATGVGLLTGFFGVGGGFVIVPALVLVLGFDMPAAVGTSLLVIAINSAAALAARLGGQVSLDWALLTVFTAAALAGVLAGHRVASRVDPSRLSAAFTVLLIAVAGYSLARSLPGLV
jgi:uncharacterized membrane protein YfcA